MRLLHLSDTHISEISGFSAMALRRMLDDCRDVPDIDAIVITGDIADNGTIPEYVIARDLIGAFATGRGIPAIFTTGNHDERTAFTEVLGPSEPIVLNGYRIIPLDSLVPGEGYGLIDPTRLRELLTEPAPEPAPNGTILAFHHPPISVPGIEIQRVLGLRNPGELAAAIAGTDVRLILCGHYHSQLFGMFAGVPVWVTPGVVNRTDLTSGPNTVRVVQGPSASVIDVDGPVIHTLHARDPHAGDLLREVPQERLAEILASVRPSAAPTPPCRE
ncbi:3',5'-cyclic AMP phosphodiesterase CpdA [Actinoplanes lutulentus]|uniref:3',5'-cyclic AMP phosphodiesterase CpdA n=1 Tax=Actinoplanes lutulentus TaxID=1287878 RepID=A0A327YXI6_9ACTN|nr:metallophosphoesterase [Actinoplanes lutulentus]MBB2940450.1 3',5'-cyclic AMP phosphodiesterase CpdA [Actinoplanes lutulentus]RAK25818.1 3',5'-cyclic AMP phosphodiesterase CpdA [Actinoplanes lutulentus]